MKKSKTLSFLRLFILFAALIFEILPYGAVCIFASPEEQIVRYFSYFSLVPYGYANFSPLITAILTCILIALALVSLFCEREGLEKCILLISLSAAVISLCPLFLGVRFFSFVGAVISVLLFAISVMSCPGRCRNE